MRNAARQACCYNSPAHRSRHHYCASNQKSSLLRRRIGKVGTVLAVPNGMAEFPDPKGEQPFGKHPGSSKDLEQSAGESDVAYLVRLRRHYKTIEQRAHRLSEELANLLARMTAPAHSGD